MYSRVVVGRVDVGEEQIPGAECGELVGPNLTHVEDVSQRTRLEATGVDRRRHAGPGAPAVTGDQRLDPPGAAYPRAVAIGRTADEFGEQRVGEKGQIAGQDQHAIRRGDIDGGVDPADGTKAGTPVWMDRKIEVGEPAGLRRDDEDFVGDPLQDLQLSNDDGVSLDDEATFVPAAEPTGLPARKDGR